MKNHEEIFKAFIDKKTITCVGGEKFKLINGNVFELKNGDWRVYNGGFNCPELWEIEQQWYEKDMRNGVLCRVKDRIDYQRWDVDIIRSYSVVDGKIAFYGISYVRGVAEPLDLTKPLLPQLEGK